VTAVPSAKDAKEESSRVTVEINQRDSSKEPDAASILGDSVQNAMTSGPCEISQKEKQCDPEVGENDKVPSLGDSPICCIDM
ncbi:microtubule-associated protein futsch-like, partial [Fagus crenata]